MSELCCPVILYCGRHVWTTINMTGLVSCNELKFTKEESRVTSSIESDFSHHCYPESKQIITVKMFKIYQIYFIVYITGRYISR